MPKYSYHYGEVNIGGEYYAGRQISVGLNLGAFYRYKIKDTLINEDILPNISTTNVYGASFSIDFKRFVGKQITPDEPKEHFLDNRGDVNEGYYFGLSLSERFVTVYYDEQFGKTPLPRLKEYFSFAVDIFFGRQYIAENGFVFDHAIGLGFVQGNILTQSYAEYALFKNMEGRFYPNLTYKLKIGKQFLKEFVVKE